MAARKKKTPASPESVSVREFTVILEDVRSRFTVFGEALQSLDAKVERGFARVDGDMAAGFARVDREMAAGFARVDQEMTARFGRVDDEFERVDHGMAAGFARVDRDIGLLKSAVTDNSRELREVRATVTRIEAALEKKVDRDEVEALVERAIAARK